MAEIKYFEDVADGEQLPSFQHTITRTHIVKYAGAGGDFNPIHHDEELAKSVGKERSIVTNTLRLLGLPEIIQDMLEQGLISSRIWSKNSRPTQTTVA